VQLSTRETRTIILYFYFFNLMYGVDYAIQRKEDRIKKRRRAEFVKQKRYNINLKIAGRFTKY